MVIAKGYATLREIEEYYSFSDIMKMVDIITVNYVNEVKARKTANGNTNNTNY